jgi:thiamine-monophosphate kinase
VLIGIGDDAAVVEPERNRVEVLSVDALVEGVHFDRAYVPPDAIGHRALAVNLSDLAAMGAEPRLALLSLVLPPALPVDEFDGIVTGFAALAAKYRVQLVGGNITRSPGPLMLDVTVIGTAKRRRTLTRSGARPGDDVYVSGTIGAAAAGLQRLKAGADWRVAADDPATHRFLRPDPRVRLGLLMGRNRAARACVDLSDGLADGVHRLAEASGVGVTIDAALLPVDPAARQWCEGNGMDATTEAIAAGDDYELLFAVKPRTSRRVAAAVHDSGVTLTRVGTCTVDRAVSIRGADGAANALPQGYSHFR